MIKKKRAKEERLREATRNNFTGLEGKFGTILKYLGNPIIGDGGSFYESYKNVDYYAPIESEEEAMPEFEEDGNIIELGHIFDGLSRGIHLEIKYFSEKQELTVYYKGFLVYSEVANDLTCYVPFPEWEDKVESIYQQAKIKEKEYKNTRAIENKQEFQREKMSLLETLKTRWGV